MLVVGGGGGRGHMKMNIPYFQMQKQMSETERVEKMGKFFSSCAVVFKLPKKNFFLQYCGDLNKIFKLQMRIYLKQKVVG